MLLDVFLISQVRLQDFCEFLPTGPTMGILLVSQVKLWDF
jgi:hypothetical protein